MITLSVFHFLAQTQSSSTDRIPTNLLLNLSEGASWRWVGIHNVFSTVLATYCLLRLLHPSGLPDFGAPNPGRRHKECSRRLGGGRPGGTPHALGERLLRPRRGGVVEDQLRKLMCIPGASVAEMAGC